MLEYLEEFMNDFMDGRVDGSNYPHAFKVVNALHETALQLERDAESDDPDKMIDALAKITTYYSNTMKAHKDNDFEAVDKAIEQFTGEEVNVAQAREDLKTYAKAKIDQL